MGNLVKIIASNQDLPAPLLKELADAQKAIIPASRKEIAVKVADTFALWTLPENWDQTAKFYLEALEGLPSDLVDEALRQARMNCKWLPKPAELREFVNKELLSRKRYAHEVQKRAKEISDAKSTVAPDERKQVGALLGVLARALNGDPGARAVLDGWDATQDSKRLYPAI